MIYLDTSVLLAALLSEDRRPDADFWSRPLISSRLLQYETWTRLNAYKLNKSHGEAAKAYFNRISFLELSLPALARAMEPFPRPVKTLDAFHLSSSLFIRESDPDLALATYDEKMTSLAKKLGMKTVKGF